VIDWPCRCDSVPLWKCPANVAYLEIVFAFLSVTSEAEWGCVSVIMTIGQGQIGRRLRLAATPLGQYRRNVARRRTWRLDSCNVKCQRTFRLGPPWLCLTPDRMNRKTVFAR
jgi:hypothetical protein